MFLMMFREMFATAGAQHDMITVSVSQTRSHTAVKPHLSEQTVSSRMVNETGDVPGSKYPDNITANNRTNNKEGEAA